MMLKLMQSAFLGDTQIGETQQVEHGKDAVLLKIQLKKVIHLPDGLVITQMLPTS